jgi:hypothetical protein
MSNKEYAIRLLQDLPADQDAVIVIFTKEDAEDCLDEGEFKITDENWASIVRDCDKFLPHPEIWDSFVHAVNSNRSTASS